MKIKHKKCLFGAIALTPIVAGLLTLSMFGFGWVAVNVPIVGHVIGVTACILLLLIIFALLYEHCLERSNKKNPG